MATLAEVMALGIQHHQAGQFARAEEIYRQVLGHDPRHGEALQLLGALKLQTGQPAEAISWIEQSIAADGGNASVLSNLGSAYLEAGRTAQARAALEEAIRRDGTFAPAHYNLGKALALLGLLGEAAASYRRCLALDPSMAAAHNNLGDLLRQLGRCDEGQQHCDTAVELNPQSPAAHYNRALLLLGRGRLTEGWEEYEWRWRCHGMRSRSFPQPLWNGQPLPGGTLLVHGEQGLGDTLQFIRLLPLVRDRCPRTIVEVQPPLLQLLTQSGFEVHAAGQPLPSFDVQVPLLSVPRALGIALDNIPAHVPYLAASPLLIDEWASRLATTGGLRVGIAWQGSPSYREDRYRSISLAEFAPLAQVPGVRLLSLQKGAGSEQIPLVQNRFSVVDLGSAADEAAGPLMDTAAIMTQLDLVITSDSALAHLAGGLGVNVWVALALAPDWRWLARRNDSPWYPTMRLFRQTTLGDWTSVFRQMAETLVTLEKRTPRGV